MEFAKEGETIEVANNETILDAGEEEGWDLPYACREGQCISCAGHIEDGPATDHIRHSNNDSLMDDDMEEGYCLTCVAYPTSEFTIETGESP
ncbi:2Fe-2S iron-sulfur cluster binding domain-containing protein [Haloarcula marismortui ATCC 33800]|uniref:2Fe-2S iron-sulfur cluster binding domain-containing protein n=1 Tax=Haloarcula marismortui ATCC 33800 TaxID=662476 RepID=A0A8T8KH55_9EURY|nr:2Fe-2S iron-sulfur cluster binding domain-containing protein [Haloarcula sinaiiensis ATCC 33800]